jgi:predicted dehydrogenase
MPYLKRAMYRAVEIGQPFVIGSRQGIPFCFLDEFRAWSDGFALSNAALSEDAPQKQRGEVCDECRFSSYCTGLWRPYAAKYGFDELRPVRGDKLTDAEIQLLRAGAMPEPWGVPRSFDDIPDSVRERELENGPPEIAAPSPAERMPEFVPHRTRPLRMAMLGSGRQARRLARAALGTEGISIDAVASPHAPQADLQDFGGCPAYSDAGYAIEDMDAEAVIVAAATPAHDELARIAIDRGVPVLVEKPLTPTLEDAEALRDHARAAGARVAMAHNSLYAPGLDEMFDALPDRPYLTYTLRRTPSSSDGMRTWSRSFLYETVYHVLALTGRACGGGAGEVAQVSYIGEARPEQLRMRLRYGEATADITLDYTGAVEEDILSLRESAAAEERTWRRQGPSITIAEGGAIREVERRGSDVQRMLASFRDFALGKVEAGATIDESIDIMRTAGRVVEAFDAAGAPFKRASAPKHVATRAAQQPFQ